MISKPASRIGLFKLYVICSGLLTAKLITYIVHVTYIYTENEPYVYNYIHRMDSIIILLYVQ